MGRDSPGGCLNCTRRRSYVVNSMDVGMVIVTFAAKAGEYTAHRYTRFLSDR